MRVTTEGKDKHYLLNAYSLSGHSTYPMFSLKKPDWNIPASYAYLKFTAKTVGHFDMYPTSVALKIECLDSNKEVVHHILTIVQFYTDIRKTDASMRQLKYALNTIRKVGPPPEGFVFDVGDIASFCIMSNYIRGITLHNKTCRGVIGKVVREHNCSLEINYVPMFEHMNQYKIEELFAFRKRMTLSEEQLGITLQMYKEQLEHERKY